MRLSLKAALLTASAMVAIGSTVSAASASTLLATVTDSYSTSSYDTAYATLTNNSTFTENNVTIFGINAGSVTPGNSVTVNLGDIDENVACYYGGCPNIPTSFTIASTTYAKTFPYDNSVFNDYYGAHGTLGTITTADAVNVPEPASITLLGAGLLGFAGARRRRRKS